MLYDSRIVDGVAEIDLRDGRLSVTDIDGVHREISALLRRQDIRTLAVNLARVDLVDNSLLNLLRALSFDARAHRRAFRLDGVPALLRVLAGSPSHRLAWLAALVPPDESAPSVAAIRRRKRSSSRR